MFAVRQQPSPRPCSRQQARLHDPPELDRHGFERKGRTVAEHTQSDTAMMRRALALAAHGPGPTPTPGSAVSSSTPPGDVVAAGWHRGAGTPARRGRRARRPPGSGRRAARPTSPSSRATTSGRTEPCAKALYAAGVARVVYAQTDPNPAAAGGAAWLRRRGVAVDGGRPRRRGAWRSTAPGRTSSPPAGPGSPGSSRPPSTAAARRPTAPASGSPATRPGPTSTSSGRGAGRSSSAPAPPCSTTPS